MPDLVKAQRLPERPGIGGAHDDGGGGREVTFDGAGLGGDAVVGGAEVEQELRHLFQERSTEQGIGQPQRGTTGQVEEAASSRAVVPR